MRLLLLGVPGAGKGTQAEIISERYELPIVATGSTLREACSQNTPMGSMVKSYLEGGNLVPDEVVIEIIRQRLEREDCRDGFILDGFPRTLPQAEALEKMGKQVERVLYIEVPDEDILKRLGGRRVCEDCGETYHVQNQPSAAGEFCEKCGGRLVVRKDDREETIRNRLEVYHTQTFPLVEYYRQKGTLREIDGSGDIETTTELTLRELEDLQ